MDESDIWDVLNDNSQLEKLSPSMFEAEPGLPGLLDTLDSSQINFTERNSTPGSKVESKCDFTGEGQHIFFNSDVGQNPVVQQTQVCQQTRSNTAGQDDAFINQLLESMFGNELQSLLGNQDDAQEDSGIELLDDLLQQLDKNEGPTHEEQQSQPSCQQIASNPAPAESNKPFRYTGVAKFKAKPAYERSLDPTVPDGVPKPFQIPNVPGRNTSTMEVVSVDPIYPNQGNVNNVRVVPQAPKLEMPRGLCIKQPSSIIVAMNQSSGSTYVAKQPQGNILMAQQPQSNILMKQQPRSNILLKQQSRSNIPMTQQPQSNILMKQQPQGNILVKQQPRSNLLMTQQPQSNILMKQQPRSNILLKQQPRNNILVNQQTVNFSQPASPFVYRVPKVAVGNSTNKDGVQIIKYNINDQKRAVLSPAVNSTTGVKNLTSKVKAASSLTLREKLADIKEANLKYSGHGRIIQDSYTKKILSKKLRDLKGKKPKSCGYLKIYPKGQQSLLKKNYHISSTPNLTGGGTNPNVLNCTSTSSPAFPKTMSGGQVTSYHQQQNQNPAAYPAASGPDSLVPASKTRDQTQCSSSEKKGGYTLIQTNPVLNKVKDPTSRRSEMKAAKQVIPSRNPSVLNMTPWYNQNLNTKYKKCSLASSDPFHSCNISCQTQLNVTKEIIRYPTSHYLRVFKDKNNKITTSQIKGFKSVLKPSQSTSNNSGQEFRGNGARRAKMSKNQVIPEVFDEICSDLSEDSDDVVYLGDHRRDREDEVDDSRSRDLSSHEEEDIDVLLSYETKKVPEKGEASDFRGKCPYYPGFGLMRDMTEKEVEKTGNCSDQEELPDI